MASHDLSTTTLISLGVSLMLSKWRHSSSSHIVESLISHIVESLISHIVESLISMAMASPMSEQPSKEEDNTRGVEVKLLEIETSSLDSWGVSLLLSRCLKYALHSAFSLDVIWASRASSSAKYALISACSCGVIMYISLG